MKSETLGLFKAAAESGVIPYYAVDTVFPVYANGKKAGAVPGCGIGLGVDSHGSDFSQACRDVEASEAYRKIKDLERFGLKVNYTVEPVLGSGKLYSRIYLYKDRGEELAGVNEHFMHAHADIVEGRFSDAYLKGLLANAEFLGIPGCCAHTYAQERAMMMEDLLDDGTMGKLEPEKCRGESEYRARVQLSRVVGERVEDGKYSVGKITNLPFETLASYYALDIFPCEPGCEDGRRIGMNVLKALDGMDPFVAELYRVIVVPFNAMRIWTSAPGVTNAANDRIVDFIRNAGASNTRYVIIEAPRGVTARTARVTEKTGRNDPCPCDSGIKYKKCHGK